MCLCLLSENTSGNSVYSTLVCVKFVYLLLYILADSCQNNTI